MWPVGSGRPGCAPWCRGAASRLVLCSRRRRRRPRALPPSRPACLARSLPPLSLSRSLSPPPLPGPPPPTPSLRLPPSLPPAARGPRPPPAARPPRPRWPRPRRCGAGPGGSADWGAPGRRGGSGLGARPVLAPSARLPGLCGPAGSPRTLQDGGPDPAAPRPCAGPGHLASAALRATPPGALLQPSPRGVPRYLALPLRWVPASSTGRRDSGPSSPWAGVSASPPAARGAPGGLHPAVLPTSTRAHCTLPASALGLGTAAPAHPHSNPHPTRHPRQVPPPSGGQPTQQGQGRGARSIQAVLEARASL